MPDALTPTLILDAPFDRAFRHLLGLEGELANQPADRGGLTKFGVSLRFLRALGVGGGGDIDVDGDVDAADITDLTPARARELYHQHFWLPSGAAALVAIAEDLASKIFEMAVVAGPGTATKIFQRALGDCRSPVAVDGKFGDQTFDAAMRISRAALTGELLQATRRRCAQHFLEIETHNHGQLVFLNGWMRRALDLPVGAS
jgi:lysozyme family protein